MKAVFRVITGVKRHNISETAKLEPMPFDLHLILSDDSREVQVIQQVASQEHITPEQAATRLLAEGAKLHGKKTPAEELIGAFSSPEDSAILDAAMEHVRDLRKTDRLRDFGV